MNINNEAVLAAFPLLALPVGSDAPEATTSGMRFLVGREGVAREINLPWITVRHLVALSTLPMPYGSVHETVKMRCGAIPRDVINTFVDDARRALPDEIAGVFLWNEATDGWRYARRRATSAGPAHINYDEVQPQDGEHIVVDVHSHGRFAAGFSQQDDADDAGAMKLSLVLGNLDQQTPSSEMRLCMAGYTLPAFIGSDGRPGVCS